MNKMFVQQASLLGKQLPHGLDATAGSWHRNESAAQVLVKLELQQSIAMYLEISGCPCLQQQGAMQRVTAAWQVHSHVRRTEEHITVGNC